jgi:hypothetical protein
MYKCIIQERNVYEMTTNIKCTRLFNFYKFTTLKVRKENFQNLKFTIITDSYIIMYTLYS